MRVHRTSNAVRVWHRRHRAATSMLGGTLAVLPAAAAVIVAGGWTGDAPTLGESGTVGVLGLAGGHHSANPGLGPVSVDGSLPEAPRPAALPAPLGSGQSTGATRLPSGPLGIPGTALKAYRAAAATMATEQPGCGIDWALIASIGRIESNHARGGFVDANGTTREPILGPVLNGIGPVAAIPDTDRGRHDGDTTWDRAVGPTQFIPSTWAHYAADGNNDGTADPNNIYDAALAAARYLCSGGFDLTQPDQLRAAIYRYNHSDTYVNTVILWAQAYRDGVTPTPDSTVPIGAPNTTTTSENHPAPAPRAPSSPPGAPTETTPSTPPAPSSPPTSSTSDVPTTVPTTPSTPDETPDPTTQPTTQPTTEPTSPSSEPTSDPTTTSTTTGTSEPPETTPTSPTTT